MGKGFLEKEIDLEGIIINLPNARLGLINNLNNINYCIQQIIIGDKRSLVVGYFILKSGIGDTETLHQLLPHKKAEELKKKYNGSFDYFTLNALLKEKKAYEKGKYRVDREGYWLGLNPTYPH